MNAVLFDTSAMIATLRAARPAAKVAGAVADPCVTAITYVQVVAHVVHAGMFGREVDAMLEPLPMTVVPVGEALAQIAGGYAPWPPMRVLSLRMFLTLAKRDGLPAWPRDGDWRTIADATEVKVVTMRWACTGVCRNVQRERDEVAAKRLECGAL